MKLSNSQFLSLCHSGTPFVNGRSKMEQAENWNLPYEDEDLQIVEEWLHGHHWQNPRFMGNHFNEVQNEDGGEQQVAMSNGHSSDSGQENGAAAGPSPPADAANDGPQPQAGAPLAAAAQDLPQPPPPFQREVALLTRQEEIGRALYDVQRTVREEGLPPRPHSQELEELIADGRAARRRPNFVPMHPDVRAPLVRAVIATDGRLVNNARTRLQGMIRSAVMSNVPANRRFEADLLVDLLLQIMDIFYPPCP